ncbi:hypothetical protein HDU98_000647 [Podochytrium sp. JEL0797]|nr:hypothetical protein HDU98_000647 [Podochytrium sp. JEL0797]
MAFSDSSFCYGMKAPVGAMSDYALQAPALSGPGSHYTAATCNTYCASSTISNINYSAMVQASSSALCYCLISFDIANPGPSSACTSCSITALGSPLTGFANCGQGDSSGHISSVAVLPVIPKVVTAAGTSAATSAAPTLNAMPVSPTSSVMAPTTITATDPGHSSIPIGAILNSMVASTSTALVSHTTVVGPPNMPGNSATPGPTSTPIGAILGGVAAALVLAIIGVAWFKRSRSKNLQNPFAAQPSSLEPEFLVSAVPVDPISPSPPGKSRLDVSATQVPLVTPEQSHTAVDIADTNLDRPEKQKQALDNSDGLFGQMEALSSSRSNAIVGKTNAIDVKTLMHLQDMSIDLHSPSLWTSDQVCSWLLNNEWGVEVVQNLRDLNCDGIYLQALGESRETCRSLLKEDFGIMDPRIRTVLAEQICGLFEQPSSGFAYENEAPPPFEALVIYANQLNPSLPDWKYNIVNLNFWPADFITATIDPGHSKRQVERS